MSKPLLILNDIWEKDPDNSHYLPANYHVCHEILRAKIQPIISRFREEGYPIIHYGGKGWALKIPENEKRIILPYLNLQKEFSKGNPDKIYVVGFHTNICVKKLMEALVIDFGHNVYLVKDATLIVYKLREDDSDFDFPYFNYLIRETRKYIKKTGWNTISTQKLLGEEQERLLWEPSPVQMEEVAMKEIEAIIVGRNDEYEPNWSDNLISCMCYNKKLLQKFGISLKFVFIEWNPIKETSYLSLRLQEKFGKEIRCYIVPPELHREVTGTPIHMLLNYAWNVAWRRVKTDWVLQISGDILLSSKTGEQISNLVKTNHNQENAYRAERWDIERATDFYNITPEKLEMVHIHNKHRMDGPCYTCGCGDFLVMPKDTFLRTGGYNESVINTRLGVDDQFNHNIYYHHGVQFIPIGVVYHIDHYQSYARTRQRGAEMPENFGSRHVTFEYPFSNPDNWGFNDRQEKLVEGQVWVIQ